MTQQTKRPNLLPYLLVLLVLVGVYGFMNKPVEAEPSYAEVRELFESEQVSAFTVTDTTLRMKLREPIDGKTELKKDLFSVTLFYDDLGELIEQQKADGIIEDYDFTADHSINYVAMFAPYILAVLGIFAIWYFLSVRSAGGGGGERARAERAAARHAGVSRHGAHQRVFGRDVRRGLFRHRAEKRGDAGRRPLHGLHRRRARARRWG